MLSKIKPYIPILLLTLGHGTVDFFGGLLQVLAPGLAAHLNIPLGEVVMLIGFASLVNNLLQPAVGYIMGKRNLAWILWVAIFVSSLPVFMGYAGNIWGLTALIVVGAVATGVYHPEAALSVHDVSGDKAYLGMPLFMAGGAALYAAATPLSIKLTETYGFEKLVWLLIPGLLVALLFFFSYRKRKREHPSIVIRPRSKRITRVQDGNISYWPLLTVAFFLCMGTGLFMSILSSHFEMRFGPEARYWGGWTLMVMGVGSSLLSFFWSSLVERRGFYPVALLTQVAAFPLFLLMAYASSPAMGFVLALPLCIMTPAVMHPAAITMAKNAAGATQALRTSLIMGGAYGAASVGVMVAGALMRRGVPSSSIVVFVAFCSLAAAAVSMWQLLCLRRKRQDFSQ